MLGWRWLAGNMRTKQAHPATLLLAAFVGLMASLAFSTAWYQPDWSLALLLAVLLSKPKTWIWVLPGMGVHDLFLYWSVTVVLPYTMIAALLLRYTDKKIGPGQPQRWAAWLLHVYALWESGMSGWRVLLTAALVVWLWSFLSSQRERVYVEPA